MRYLLDSKQVRTLEASICQTKDVTLAQLMQMAGSACWHQLQRAYGGRPLSMVVFLGSGNNAGDGLVCALHAIKAGVNVYLYGVKSIKSPLALQLIEDHHAEFSSCWIDDVSQLTIDVAVDAMLGIGLTGEPGPEILKGIECFNALSAFKVAIDIATGISADSGHGHTYCLVDHTITFFAPKIGHFFGHGRDATKSLTVSLKHLHDGSGYHHIDQVSLPDLPKHSHKYQRGSVAVIAGESSMQGAGIMAAEAALFMGAGIVKLYTLYPLVRNIHPAIMVNEFKAAGIDDCVHRHSVCLVGPGMGAGAKQQNDMAQLLTRDLTLVIDAEGLKNLPHGVKIEQPCVLTPHVGEAAYLLNTTTDYVLNHPIEAALTIQRLYQAAVILKSSATVIVMNEQVALITQGSALLATAGSGDVLAGITASLIAQHGLTSEVLQAAVLLHAHQANAWQTISQRPMVATDLYLNRRSL